jgi:hypothetical protein
MGDHVLGSVIAPGGCTLGATTVFPGNIGYTLIEVNMTHISTTLTVEFNGGVSGIQNHVD